MSKNVMKSFIMLAALSGLFLGVGSFFGRGGLYIALAFSVMMNMGAYFFSDKLVIRMTRARPVSEAEAPWLYRTVARLAAKANMPMPRLYIMPASQPNAFATGRNPQRAVVAVTEGILDVLNEEELEGVLAHEISHVKNRDVLIGAIAATIAAAITMLARLAMWSALLGGGGRDSRNGNNPFAAVGLLLSIVLAPLAAMMIQMAVSRARESEADRTGAHIHGDPTPLANALIKIHQAARTRPAPAVNPAVSHVFLMNPLGGVQGVSKLFMSHPPLEQRLEQLRALGARV